MNVRCSSSNAAASAPQLIRDPLCAPLPPWAIAVNVRGSVTDAILASEGETPKRIRG